MTVPSRLTDLLRRAAEALRPVSPLGWTVLVVALVGWLAAVRFGWVEGAMIAAGAGVLFVCSAALALGRTRVAIDAEVSPARVVAGEPATGLIRVTNVGRMPKLPLVVELPIGATAARFVLPALTSGASHEEIFVVPTERRGVVPVGPATTVQGDPFGLVRRSLTWTETTELIVHPRTVPLDPLGSGLLRDLEGTVSEDQSRSDLAFHTLREYQPGDDRRYIHWRSSAKAGRLLVRQFLDTRRSHLTVVVDPDPAGYREGATPHDLPPDVEADLETAISVGGSLVLRAIRDEQDATIVCGPHRVTRGSGVQFLDELARVEVGPHDVEAAAIEAVELAPDTSVAVLVTGPRRPFHHLQRAAHQFGPEVRVVAVIVDPSAGGGIRQAGRIVVLTLGELGDLRRLLVSGMAR